MTSKSCVLSPFHLLLAAALVSLCSKRLSFCTSSASLFFTGAKSTAKWRDSASKGISAFAAHIQKAANYGAAACAGVALAPAVAGSGLGIFGFRSGIVKGSICSMLDGNIKGCKGRQLVLILAISGRMWCMGNVRIGAQRSCNGCRWCVCLVKKTGAVQRDDMGLQENYKLKPL